MRIKVALPEGDPRESVRLLRVGVVTHEPAELELTEAQLESLRGKGYQLADARGRRGGRRAFAAPAEETVTEEQPAAPAPSEGEV